MVICNKPHCFTTMVEKDGKLICPQHDVPYKERNLMEKYLVELGDPHNLRRPMRVNTLDYFLRESIGKTDDIHIAMCSHKAIINRELGDKFCRVCQKDLSIVGVGRWNDYLVLRHPQCQQPICIECAKNNPDEFHKAFQKGLCKYKIMKQIGLSILREREAEGVYG